MQDGCRVGTVEEEAARPQSCHREERELHGGDDSEVALASTQRPEQVGFRRGVDMAQRAVGRDCLQGGDVVGRPSVRAAHGGAQAPAEGVADDSDERGGAVERGKPERDRRVDHLLPADSRRHVGGAGCGVDVHPRHAVRGDEDRVVGRDGRLVAGGQDGDRQLPLGGETDGDLHVGAVRGADDDVRVVGHGEVEGRALLGEPFVFRSEHGTGDLRGQTGARE